MRRLSSCLFLIALFASLAAFADDAVPLLNWPVPGTSATAHRLQARATADLAGPLIFVPVTPCRVVDTRNANGSFGGPIFASGETRSYTIPSGPCTGIPTGIQAFSLNFSVTQTRTSVIGFLTAWPTGTTQPSVANLTWFAANQTLSAASIVPAASGGAISVYAAQSTHVIIDINGYFLGNGNTLNSAEHLALVGSWDGGLIRGSNSSTLADLGTAGVKGVVLGAVDEVSGVNGRSRSAGANFGVSGITELGSAGSAGVLGVSNVNRPVIASTFPDAGVRG